MEHLEALDRTKVLVAQHTKYYCKHIHQLKSISFPRSGISCLFYRLLINYQIAGMCRNIPGHEYMCTEIYQCMSGYQVIIPGDNYKSSIKHVRCQGIICRSQVISCQVISTIDITIRKKVQIHKIGTNTRKQYR